MELFKMMAITLTANCISVLQQTVSWSNFLGKFPQKWAISIVNLCSNKFSCGHANGVLVNLVLLNFLNRERQT